MLENFELARETLRRAALRQKRLYDRNAESRDFQVGQWVLRFYTPLRNKDKLHSPYVGPYLVVGKPGEVTYTIQESKDSAPFSVHADHLKAYLSETPPESWIVVAPSGDADVGEGVEGPPVSSDGGADVADDGDTVVHNMNTAERQPVEFHDVDINDAREEDGDGGEDAVVLEELPEGGNVPQVEGEPQVEGVRRGNRVRRPTSRYDELVCW